MRADQFITEVSMKPSRLSQMADVIPATVGMEFELLLPKFELDSDYNEPEKNYEEDRKIRSIDDVISFFEGDYNNRNTLKVAEKKLRDEYHNYLYNEAESEWKNVEEEQLMEYYVIHNPEMSDEERNEAVETDMHLKYRSREYRITKEHYIEQYLEDGLQREYREKEFLVDTYGSNMSDMESVYDLTWPYWTIPSTESAEESNYRETANSLAPYLKPRDVIYNVHHDGRRWPNTFTVEPDASVQAFVNSKNGSPEQDSEIDESKFGVEIVSPTLDIYEMIKTLTAIKSWANNYGAYTNNTCGLHMSVSVPGFSHATADYIKLVLLLGDKHILEQFERQANEFTVSVLDKLQAQIKNEPSQLYSDQYILRAFAILKNTLNKTGKQILTDIGLETNYKGYVSINPHNKGENDYIEFRGPGNDWLGMLKTAEGTNTIVNTLLRCVVVLDASTKPELYRQEYLKKLYTLLSPYQDKLKKGSDSVIQLFAAYVAGALDSDTLKRKLNVLKFTPLNKNVDNVQYDIYSNRDPNRKIGSFTAAPAYSNMEFVNALRKLGQNKPTDFTYVTSIQQEK